MVVRKPGASINSHRLLGKRRWDDVIHHTAEDGVEDQWQDAAQECDWWAGLEGSFMRRILRNAAMHEVPHSGTRV